MKLRSYQTELVALASCSENVMIQADTGAGKTLVIAELARTNQHVLCIAHRIVLVKQASKVLAQFKIQHNVLASKQTQRQCTLEHRKLGYDNLLSVDTDKIVCSIDSLLSHYKCQKLTIDTTKPWLILVDEAHHATANNKWGKLLSIFQNARIVGVTATPWRLDGESLSSKSNGIFDKLIQASELRKDSVRTLINKGFLSDFQAYSIPERIDSNKLTLGTHDYTYKSLDKETRRVTYEMAGDAIKHYTRLADGKQGLIFCLSIEIAEKTAKEFRRAGISSACIHSKQSTTESERILNMFEQRVINILVNVDMIGEGVDIPSIEVLIMLRKTASFGLYRQWCGRSLRPEKGKKYAILIDHVGNIRNHGLPDRHIAWNLDNPPEMKKSNLSPCPACCFLIKAWTNECPNCGLIFQDKDGTALDADVKYIDFQLVKMKRITYNKKLAEHARQKELHERLQLDIKNITTLSVLEKSIHRLKTWVASVLIDASVSIYDINSLILKELTTDFWIERFTLSDLKNNNKEKAIKVYKQWLKSQ